MEICSWDWGAIATFTASGMALIISHQWRIQKRSERSSEIAKETYKSLLFVRNQITEYVNHCRKLNVYSNRALSIEESNEVLSVFREKNIAINDVWYNFIINLEILNKISPIESIDKIKESYQKINDESSEILFSINFRHLEISKKFNITELTYKIYESNKDLNKELSSKDLENLIINHILYN